MKYDVWYMRPEFFCDGIMGAKPDPLNLTKTHIYLRSVEVSALDALYHRQQGEVWSPNGEARDLIRSKGLQHTSMSVGDVAVDIDGEVFLVANVGWEKLVPEPSR